MVNGSTFRLRQYRHRFLGVDVRLVVVDSGPGNLLIFQAAGGHAGWEDVEPP